VLAALEHAGVGLASISVAQPSLDDVYLHHAGRSFGEADRLGTDPSRSSEAVAA
jgi:ABC-2 type transport system ATP-binding protein